MFMFMKVNSLSHWFPFIVSLLRHWVRFVCSPPSNKLGVGQWVRYSFAHSVLDMSFSSKEGELSLWFQKSSSSNHVGWSETLISVLVLFSQHSFWGRSLLLKTWPLGHSLTQTVKSKADFQPTSLLCFLGGSREQGLWEGFLFYIFLCTCVMVCLWFFTIRLQRACCAVGIC